MTVKELREKYLRFFAEKGHDVFPSGSLVPYDVTGRLDESLLFNGAGMVQFKPYFRGVAEPANTRLTTAQKCLRTGDIDEVGDDSHLTFFEMLGNFSFGDYFQEEAIAFSWEFLTGKEWLGIDPRKLSFTVFEEDEAAYGLWLNHFASVGIDGKNRVFKLGEKTNYWPAGAFSAGPPGPCGPNSEMFYWTGEGFPPDGEYGEADFERDDEAGLWMEIWNDVFIQYEWQGELADASRPDKGWVKTGMPGLPFKSVDTGMGLERTVAVLSGKSSVYDTDAFTGIFAAIAELSDQDYIRQSEARTRAKRIVADHVRAAVFCLADGVLPSNTGRGYVLRRLIRRACRAIQNNLVWRDEYLSTLAEVVIKEYGEHYKELVERRAFITQALDSEALQYVRTSESSVREINEYVFNLTQKYIERIHAFLKAGISLHLGDLGPNHVGIVTLAGGSDRKAYAEAVRTFVSFGGDKSLVQLGKNLVQNTKQNLYDYEIHRELTDSLDRSLLFNGSDAYHLFETYGASLDDMVEIAAKQGLDFDYEGFERAKVNAQELSRAGGGMDTVYGGGGVFSFVVIGDDGKATPTEFLGYERESSDARVVGAMPVVEDGKVHEGVAVLALDRTPFYAESGGQVGDTGWLRFGDGTGLEVTNVTKQDGVFIHLVEGVGLGELAGMDEDGAKAFVLERFFNQEVGAEVDGKRRKEITRNHTATHLLHAALRDRLGEHVTQAGSLVGPDALRFDFTHGAGLASQELADIEGRVYEEILRAVSVETFVDVPMESAREMGAMMLFGEKYADLVRVVTVGEFSKELCGGIHVGNTGEIGLFKIVSEGSVASGVRRVTAVTGMGAYQHVNEEHGLLVEAAAKLKSVPKEIVGAVDKTLEALKEEKKKREKLAQQGAASGFEETIVGEFALRVQKLQDAEANDAKLVAEKLVEGSPMAVALVSNVADGKVSFACKVGEGALAKGAKAGDIVREVAKAVGGGGGGRPEFATAGGRDASKIEEALAKAAEVLGAI